MKGKILIGSLILLGASMRMGVNLPSFSTSTNGTSTTNTQIENLKSTKNNNMLTADMWNKMLDLFKNLSTKVDENTQKLEKNEQDKKPQIVSYFQGANGAKITNSDNIAHPEQNKFRVHRKGNKGQRATKKLGEYSFCSL